MTDKGISFYLGKCEVSWKSREAGTIQTLILPLHFSSVIYSKCRYLTQYFGFQECRLGLFLRLDLNFIWRKEKIECQNS